AGRTRAICRLHALLAAMLAGGLVPQLSAQRAAQALRRIRPLDAVGAEHKRLAGELLDDVRRHDHARRGLKARITTAVRAANTTVTDRTNRSIIRTQDPPSPQPPRQLPTQPRDPRRRA